MNDSTSALMSQAGLKTHVVPIQADSPINATSREDDGFLPFGEDGLTFLDLIDIVNPLQHIPIISSIYRNLTGDTVDPASKIAGGALFGGPFGAASSLFGVIIKESTGKDIGDHVMAFFSGDDEESSQIEIARGEDATRSAVNYAEVMEWAQNEARAGMISFSIQNAELQTPNGQHLEVSQWAKNVTQGKPSINESPVITGAELDLLKIEAATAKASAQTAQLTANPSAPSIQAEQKIVSDNIEVQRWAQQAINSDYKNPNTAENTVSSLNAQAQLSGATAKKDGWFNEAMISALDSYGNGEKLASIDQKFSIDQKY